MWESEASSRLDYEALLRRRQLGLVPAYRLPLSRASDSLLPRLSLSLPRVQLLSISMLAPLYARFLASLCSRAYASMMATLLL
jgi:hypothetical protein